MSKSKRLREGDIRAVYRLLSDLREMRHDRPAMHLHIVESLLKMIGATGGFIADATDWRPDGTPMLQSFVVGKEGIERVTHALSLLAVRNNLWDDPTFSVGVKLDDSVVAVPFHQLITDEELVRSFELMSEMKVQLRHVDHLLGWHQKEARPGAVTGVSLHRYGRGEKLFSGRETAVVRLFFEELHWLHLTGRLTPVVPGVEKLSSRLKQILQLMLRGQAPKQIATELDLSLHTVREHICRLYERVGVSGRDELMAKFVRSSPTQPK